MNSSIAWQLAWALATVLVVYVLASSAKRTVAIGALLVMIPFQTVVTRYATSSVLMAYALAVILLLNGGLKVRMLPALGLIVLGYLISLSQADRALMSFHAIYMFQFFSCLVVFLLAYNFSRLVESERTVIDILLAINVLVLGYCVLQLSAGPGVGFVPFGIDALEFNKNRHAGDARLVGPFDNPGSTAGYFTLMIMVCAVELIFARGRRRLMVQALVLLNLVGMVATGNRAGFLVMVGMFPVLLLSFKKELGARRVTQYLLGGVAVLALASAVVVSYTGFGRMFERLGDVTETENGVPMTRTLTWPIAIEKIKEHPWVGEGPFFVDAETADELGWLRSEMSPYPHSLYLFLLRTIGVIGLLPVVWFFIQAWRILYATLKREPAGAYSSALLRLGLVLIVSFLAAQITLEFNRRDTIDYAQFIFALVGMLVGVADRQTRSAPVGAALPTNGLSPAQRFAGGDPVAS